VDKDTRTALDKFKHVYGLEDDDIAIRYLIQSFENTRFAGTLKEYLEYRRNMESSGK